MPYLVAVANVLLPLTLAHGVLAARLIASSTRRAKSRMSRGTCGPRSSRLSGRNASSSSSSASPCSWRISASVRESAMPLTVVSMRSSKFLQLVSIRYRPSPARALGSPYTPPESANARPDACVATCRRSSAQSEPIRISGATNSNAQGFRARGSASRRR